jgi:hypothetical protein
VTLSSLGAPTYQPSPITQPTLTRSGQHQQLAKIKHPNFFSKFFCHLIMDYVLPSLHCHMQLHGVEKLMQDQGPRGSTASSSGGIMAALWGHREADITPAEYRKAREALSGLRYRWEQLASAATREAAPRQRQRVALTKQDQEVQELLRVQVGTPLNLEEVVYSAKQGCGRKSVQLGRMCWVGGCWFQGDGARV